jgi:HSP20 family protein
MNDKFFVDIGRMLDEIFETAENFKNAFEEGMNFGPEHGRRWRWHEGMDFYPSYMYPPANVAMREDKTMVFEFALAGFDENSIELELKGDYMVLTAKVPDAMKPEENLKYFKRRLKLKDVPEQRYYVPADKFDRDNVKAVFRNGILKVEIPAKEGAGAQEGVKINIEKEGE